MAVWDDLLSEHDRKVIEAKGANRLRQPRGLGERPALLVIDMNIGAVGEDRPIYEQLDRYPVACGPYAWASIRHMQKLLPQARRAGIPIIYTKQIHRAIHDLPRRYGSSSPAKDPSDPFSELSPQSNFQPETAPQPGDLIVEKNRPSAFFQTPLLNILLTKQVDTILITGNSTSGCVRATTVDASYYPCFRVAVVEECVFDRLELSHKANLHDIHMKYADVLPVREVIAYLEVVARRGRNIGEVAN